MCNSTASSRVDTGGGANAPPPAPLVARPEDATILLPRRRRAATLVVASSLVLVACSIDGTDRVAGDDAPAGDTSGRAGVPGPASVKIDGADLLLGTADDRHVVATLDDGELLHAEVRPGAHGDGAVTVLVLARIEGRYELRYVTHGPSGTTDLYGFPSRLQVDPDAATIVEVPTLPVWAPDGSAIAWLEWDGDGTVLRTVGWLDHDAGTNPADDQAAYRVGELAPGSQLESWTVADDGTPALVARDPDGERWQVRIEDQGVTLVAA